MFLIHAAGVVNVGVDFTSIVEVSVRGLFRFCRNRFSDRRWMSTCVARAESGRCLVKPDIDKELSTDLHISHFLILV